MRNFDLTTMALKILGMLLIITLPIRPALIAAAVLVFADLILGVWASLKEGKPFTSTGLRRTIVKMLAYEVAIFIGFLLQTYLLQDMAVVNVITGLIGVTEGKSLFENIHRLTGIDFWGAIISKLNLPDNKLNPPDDKK